MVKIVAQTGVIVAVLLAVGCGVDDRTLVEFSTMYGPPRDGGSGGAPGDAGSPDGASSSGADSLGPVVMPDGGPVAAEAGVAVGRCPDLDGNGVVDCDETLVKNPGFASDGAEWAAETGAVQAWKNEDGQRKTDSGSLTVTNQVMGMVDTSTMAGSRQCVPVTGEGVVKLAAQVFIPSGQGNALAGLNAASYASADCTGTTIGSFTSTLVSARDRWTVAVGQATLGSTARSLLVRLAVVKGFREGPQGIQFDNVLVRRM